MEARNDLETSARRIPPLNGSNPAPNMDSLVKQPPPNLGGMGGFSELVLRFASVADDIPMWGVAPAARDIALRNFWPTEPILSGAMFSTVASYAAFGWTLDGPDRMVNIVSKSLHSAEYGAGWEAFIIKVLIDMFTQDNGSFIEILRTEDNPYAPVVTLNHLDSGKCIRTGRPLEPVLYVDREGLHHLLKWYQVFDITDMPSPVESMRGMQYSACSRILRAAQIMRDIGIYKREKLSGRFHRSMYFVSGVQRRVIDEQLRTDQMSADGAGLLRFMTPVIVAGLDPSASVKVEKIDFASLPDGFDEETTLKWYITQLALAFGQDYQTFAPLPGGNLGSSQQSEVLHLKARGKGPRLFMKLLEHKFNYHGIMPRSVKFEFGDQDISEDMTKSRLRLNRAKTRSERIKSGEITPEIARQIAVDEGDLDPKYLKALAESDLTPDVNEDGLPDIPVEPD